MILKAYKQHFSRNEWIFFAVAAVIHTIIFSLYLPGSDDFYYPFISGSNDKITSLWQIIPSNIYGYTHINGRFFTHCTVQLLLFLGGGWLLYISSGIVFGLFLFMLTLLHRLSREQYSTNTADKYLITLLTLFLVPNLGGNYFGHTACTVNYLWGSAAAAFMLLCHRYFSTHPNTTAMRRHWWLLPIVFIAATWNESFGISVVGALLVYTLFTLRSTNRNTWILLATMCAGVLFSLLSPGNINRFMSTVVGEDKAVGFTLTTLVYKFTGLLPYILKRTICILFTIVLCLVSIAIDLTRHKRIVFLRQNSILFLVSLIIMLFAMFVTFYGAYMMNVASVVAALQGAAFCRHYFKPLSPTASTVAKVLAVAIMAIDFIPGALARNEAHQAWKQIEHQILTSDNTLTNVDTSPIVKANDRIVNTIGERYVDFCLFYVAVMYDIESPFQQGIFFYYDKPDATALPVDPNDLLSILTPANRISDSLYLIPGYSNTYLHVMPIETDPRKTYAHIRAKALRPVDKIKDHLRHRDSRTFIPQYIDLTAMFYETDKKRYAFIPATYTFNRQLLSIEIKDYAE